MVAKVGGHYRPVFQIHCGVTQGDSLSPTIFNMVIDAVIRHWVIVVGGVTWPSGHDPHLSLVVPEAHLVGGSRQGVERSLGAGAFWRRNESFIGMD